MLSIEAGHRLGHFAHHRSEDEKESPVSVMTSSILGLTAFMLAFTFGVVSNRYYQKKELVRDDASAIKIAYQRADFLPQEKDRIEAKGLLKEYLDFRLAFAQERNIEGERVKTVLLAIQKIQSRLWDMAVTNARKDMNSDVAALYIESLNEVERINMLRVAIGMQERLPSEIWLVLSVITVFGMVGIGYQTGIAGSKRSFAGPMLAITFAMVFALIATLDRPAGVIQVAQQPLIDLRNNIG